MQAVTQMLQSYYVTQEEAMKNKDNIYQCQ